MRRASETELGDFKREAFRNCVRLFLDGCLLFRQGRYPSAYGLGVLSYEELGKAFAIDWACDAISLNPVDGGLIYDSFLAPGLLHDHLFKQRRAHADTASMEAPTSALNTSIVHGGGLEAAKRRAFYVELEAGSVIAPPTITKEKARLLLRDVLTAIEASGDIGFSGFHARSTSQSRRQAVEMLRLAGKAFALCEPS